MRICLIPLGAALLAISACGPSVPASNAGPGFQDYTDYELERAQRDAALRGTPVVTSQTPSVTQVTVAGDGAPAPVQAPVTTNNPGISDEQSFSAVTGRESIESDAQRRAAQAAAYQVVNAGALPGRRGSSGPNVVQYALETTNLPGQAVYARSGSRSSSACGRYASSDAAQLAFLKAGGPDRDRLGLDPDGDGFACGWDPMPFRRAAR